MYWETKRQRFTTGHNRRDAWVKSMINDTSLTRGSDCSRPCNPVAIGGRLKAGEGIGWRSIAGGRLEYLRIAGIGKGGYSERREQSKSDLSPSIVFSNRCGVGCHYKLNKAPKSGYMT